MTADKEKVSGQHHESCTTHSAALTQAATTSIQHREHHESCTTHSAALTQAATLHVPSIAYLLISQGVHVAHNLGSHLASLCDAVLKGALNDGHDQSQGRSVDEVNKLGGQQLLQTKGGALGRLLQRLQQDGHDGCKQLMVFQTWRSATVHTSSSP